MSEYPLCNTNLGNNTAHEGRAAKVTDSAGGRMAGMQGARFLLACAR